MIEQERAYIPEASIEWRYGTLSLTIRNRPLTPEMITDLEPLVNTLRELDDKWRQAGSTQGCVAESDASDGGT